MKKNPAENDIDGFDLSALENTSLSSLAKPKKNTQATPETATHGKIKHNEHGWYDIPLKLIEEDPKQPRKIEDFNEDTLKGLAQSIESSGLMHPISLREHPDKPGMYMINSGARRFRAFHILKRKTIPATIVKPASRIAQFIENMQRESLTPGATLSIIDECFKTGMKAKDIAEEFGVKPTYITRHKKILDTEIQEIRDAFTAKRFVGGATVAYELILLANGNNEAVRNYIASQDGEITRKMIENLKSRLSSPDQEEEDPPEQASSQFEDAAEESWTARQNTDEPEDEEQTEDNHETSDEDNESEFAFDNQETTEPQPPKPPKMHFFGEYKEEVVTILTKEPSGRTKAVVKMASGEEKEVPIKNLKLIRIWSE